jgi:hypothetical protein
LSELAETIVLLALVATRRHFHLETDWQSLLALLEGWV